MKKEIVDYYSFTDKGKVRDINQDSVLCAYNSDGDFLAIVSDGIGGHKAGDIASLEIVTYLSEAFSRVRFFEDSYDVEDFIKKSIFKANARIYKMSKTNPEYKGMGATITGLLFSKFGIYWFNAGDSRIYSFDKGFLKQISIDHTLVNELLKSNLITKEEALIHPKRHRITKAIGIWPQVDIDYGLIDNAPDYFLVCSDGLYGFASEKEIVDIFNNKHLDSMMKAKKMMKTALDNGGGDNISLILISLNEVDE